MPAYYSKAQMDQIAAQMGAQVATVSDRVTALQGRVDALEAGGTGGGVDTGGNTGVAAAMYLTTGAYWDATDRANLLPGSAQLDGTIHTLSDSWGNADFTQNDDNLSPRLRDGPTHLRIDSDPYKAFMTTGAPSAGGTNLFATPENSFYVCIAFSQDVVANNGTLFCRGDSDKPFSIYTPNQNGDLSVTLRGVGTPVVTGNLDAGVHVLSVWWDGQKAYAQFDDNAAVECAVGTAADETDQNFTLAARSNGTGFNALYDFYACLMAADALPANVRDEVHAELAGNAGLTI